MELYEHVYVGNKIQAIRSIMNDLLYLFEKSYSKNFKINKKLNEIYKNILELKSELEGIVFEENKKNIENIRDICLVYDPCNISIDGVLKCLNLNKKIYKRREYDVHSGEYKINFRTKEIK